MDKTVEFYGGLFGWDIPEPENAEQTGGYRVATSGGRSVAGVMPLMQEGQPPVWSSYLSRRGRRCDRGEGEGRGRAPSSPGRWT